MHVVTEGLLLKDSKPGFELKTEFDKQIDDIKRALITTLSDDKTAASASKTLTGGSKLKSTKEQLIFALIRAMDRVFGVSIDGDEISTLPEHKRKSAFLRYFRALAPAQHDMLKRGKVNLTARAVDNVMYKQFKSELASMRNYVRLSLVDTILISMGLPAETQILHSKGETFCERRHRLLQQIQPIDPEMQACWDRFRIECENTLGIKVSTKNGSIGADNEIVVGDVKSSEDEVKEARRNWSILVCRCVQASKQFRFLQHAFMASTEYEGEELWNALKNESRYFVTAEALAGENVEYGENMYMVGTVADLRSAEDVSKKLKELSDNIRSWAKGEGDAQGAEGAKGTRKGPQNTDAELNTTTTDVPKMPLLIAPSALNAVSVQLGKTIKSAYDISGVMSNDAAKKEEAEDPIILRTLRTAALQMMRCDAVAGLSVNEKDPSNSVLLPMPDDVMAKQMRIISKQAKTLCLLPKSECTASPGCMWLSNMDRREGLCMVANGKQVWDDSSGKVEWASSNLFSKTAPTRVGLGGSNELTTQTDVWRVGFDTIKEKLLPSEKAR